MSDDFDISVIPSTTKKEVGGMVFEIYPRTGKSASTSGTRLGFRVPSVPDAVAAVEGCGGKVLTRPAASEWGLRAVIADLDGHKVELTE